MNPVKSPPSKAVDPSSDFAEMVELLSRYAKAKNCLDALTNDAQTEFLGLVDDHKAAYAEHQQTVTETEARIEEIARRHESDWFATSKTVKTPFGTVSLRSTSKLAMDNEEVTILLIQRSIEREIAEGSYPPGEEPSRAFLRERTELNLEALEKLSDLSLKTLRIARVTEESCTVKPVKIDLGKAVKEAAAEGRGA